MSDRRRALMGINQGIEPLYIYAEGESGLRNGVLNGDNIKVYSHNNGENNCKFTNKALELIHDGSHDESREGFVHIGELDFSKYNTLNIDCQSGIQISDPNNTYGYYAIGYLVDTGKGWNYHLKTTIGDCEEYVYTCRDTDRKIYTFDISNVVGNEVAILAVNRSGSRNQRAGFSNGIGPQAGECLFIYNIWLA